MRQWQARRHDLGSVGLLLLAALLLFAVMALFARRYLFIYPAGLLGCLMAGWIKQGVDWKRWGDA